MLRKSRFVLVGLTVIAIILTACQPQVVTPTATPQPQAVAPTATPPPQAAAPTATPPPTAEAATIRIGGLGRTCQGSLGQI